MNWKKQKEELEDLVTQEPSKHNYIRILTFVFALLFSGSLHLYSQQDTLVRSSLKDDRSKYDYLLAEGLRYKMLGNSEQAETFFRQCIDIYPEKPVPYYEMAIAGFVKKDYVLTESMILAAIQRAPDNIWYRQLLAQLLIEQTRYEEAGKEFEEIFQISEDQYEYLLASAQYYSKADNWDQHLAILRRLKKNEATLAQALVMEKDYYLKIGKEKKAIKVLRELTTAFPDKIDYRGLLAELLVETGRDKEALEEYEIIKASNPENPIVFFSLGQYYLNQGEREKAIAELVTGFESKQVNPEIKYSLFTELIRSNESDSLNEDLTKLLETMYDCDAGHPGIDALYAEYVYTQGDTDAAERIYKRMAEGGSADFLTWQRLLFIQNDQLDFEEMYRYGKLAVRSFPNQSLFYMFHGIACNALNKYDEAVEVLKKGKRLNVGNSELTKQYYISLGDALYHSGNPEEAFRNFDLLLVLDGNNAVVLNNYAYYLSVLDQDLDKALEMIEKCMEIEPDNPTYLDTYAWVLYRLKRYEDALNQIERVITLDKEASGEVMEHYGDILFVNGKIEEAVRAWKEAEKLPGASEKVNKKILNRSLDVN